MSDWLYLGHPVSTVWVCPPTCAVCFFPLASPYPGSSWNIVLFSIPYHPSDKNNNNNNLPLGVRWLSRLWLFLESESLSLRHVWLFATLWTVACQAPLSMEFFRQEYWSGLPFPSPGDLPDLVIEHRSPALQADSLPFEPPGLDLFQTFCFNCFLFFFFFFFWYHSSRRGLEML